MTGPFQVLKAHGQPVNKRQKVDSERNEPNSLASLYESPQDTDITLLQFEEFALQRLRVLKGLELLKSQGRKEADFRKGVAALVDSHLKGDTLAGSQLLDNASHFALRLAFCRTEDNRRWFVAQESELFRHRFESLLASERVAFLKQSALPYEAMEESDLDPHWEQLKLCILHNNVSLNAAVLTPAYFSKLEFFRVPFERVPELVATRRVVLHRGDAFVPSDQLAAVIVTEFRERLSNALIMTAGRWATSVADQESSRLAPIILSLANRTVDLDAGQSSGAGSDVKISLAQLPALAQRHFPLCMQQLYSNLMSDRHLRHAGRIQLGLFLKKAGLTLEESMLFWKQAFAPRTTGEKFDKEYAYNVRHSYGKEGRRKDYEAQNCLKIIAATPGVGEYHGCPFKTMNVDTLSAAMSRCGVAPGLAREAVAKAKGGHYQVACARAFEGLYGEAPDAGVTHPNAYLAESLEVVQRRAGDAAGAAAPTPPPRTPVPATPGGAQTPSTGMRTPSAAPFIRTPVMASVTPQLGGGIPMSARARAAEGSTPASECPSQTSPVLGLRRPPTT